MLTIPTPLVLTVVDATGRSHQVIGWAAEIIGQVLVHADEINGAPLGRLTADFGPTSGLDVGFYRKFARVKR